MTAHNHRQFVVGCYRCELAEDEWLDVSICYECGNDDGPYGGLCLDCLERQEE